MRFGPVDNPTENYLGDTPAALSHLNSLGGTLSPMTASRRSLPVRLSPRPVRTLGRRIAASRARDDAGSYLRRNGFVALGCLLIVLSALAIGFATRGTAVTWDGFQDVRPGVSGSFQNP